MRIVLEDIRREILGVPDGYPNLAHDYLDDLAEKRMDEVRAMMHAAPTPLARVLIETGATRAQLAEAVGVSAGAVGHWASGEKPLPATRLAEISAYLHVAPSDLMDGHEAPQLAGELSYIGWIIRFIVMVGPHAPTRADIALKLGVTLAKLRAYTHGGEEVPEAIVHEFTRAFLSQSSTIGIHDDAR